MRTAALGKSFTNNVDFEVVKVDTEDAHGQFIIVGARVGRGLRRHLEQFLRGRAASPRNSGSHSQRLAPHMARRYP